MDSKVSADLIALMEKAAEFHGHLGPFLVIGVRIGKTVKQILNNEEYSKLQATVKIPLLTPFSCVIDGIQAITHCTVGNQKLRIENSQKEITVYFKLQNSDRTLNVSVNQKTIEDLMNKISEGAPNEELAWKIANMPENQLFTIENQ
jgi:formylmethanofuran dehydrogenase subunit E